jgi:hypothetical protein
MPAPDATRGLSGTAVLRFDLRPVDQAVAPILETSTRGRTFIPLHCGVDSTDISSEAAIQVLHCVLRNLLSPVVAEAAANSAGDRIISIDV